MTQSPEEENGTYKRRKARAGTSQLQIQHRRRALATRFLQSPAPATQAGRAPAVIVRRQATEKKPNTFLPGTLWALARP